MQLLCSRLGATLYTTVGKEWATEGYWQFGRNQGITDALAEQYLVTHDGVWREYADGLYTTTDSEFPGETIHGVTLQQARKMGWAYIVATLDDNQQGFSLFADDAGAQYVLQVGNTGQYVDWSLDPLALVSSEVPIRGRGIVYHQEMDAVIRVFGRMGKMPGHRIASFVNCFPQIRRDHPYIDAAWDEAKALLPGWNFREYGIDGEHGILKPIGELAHQMAFADFVWHDKIHGDGFGHVIHMAAAIGRPLIGHGWHYRGKMAEVFWTPETAIDLDIYSIPEAAQLIREIAADPERHAAMCRAIRAVFDANVHYNQEADQIADFLGIRTLVAA